MNVEEVDENYEFDTSRDELKSSKNSEEDVSFSFDRENSMRSSRRRRKISSKDLMVSGRRTKSTLKEQIKSLKPERSFLKSFTKMMEDNEISDEEPALNDVFEEPEEDEKLAEDDEIDEKDSIGDENYEESEEDTKKVPIWELKDGIIYEFKKIREKFPKIALPRITKKMKYAKMCRLLADVQTRIELKRKVANIKMIMVLGFLAFQWVGSKAGLNTAGFTMNQMENMRRYDGILRQFGEVNWMEIGQDWPPYLKLIIMMSAQFGIFIVAKAIFKATGKDLTAEFNRLFASVTSLDDGYKYVEPSSVGLDEEDETDNGGIFSMIRNFMGVFGGGAQNNSEPRRSRPKGPSYKRKR